jgi:hypothetical protein
MLLALVFAGCFLTGVFCSVMFFVTLIAGDGLQLWTIQGAFGAGVLACIGWITHQIDTYGWDGMGWMAGHGAARSQRDPYPHHGVEAVEIRPRAPSPSFRHLM